jgi:hypothetical protein
MTLLTMSLESRSWSEITEFYRNLVENHGWDMSPMLSLVEEIATSAYIHGIQATTSHATLCIWQYPEIEFDKNTIRIDFDNGHFIFRYRESPYASKEWRKVCEREEGFITFEYVISKLRWFLE